MRQSMPRPVSQFAARSFSGLTAIAVLSVLIPAAAEAQESQEESASEIRRLIGDKVGIYIEARQLLSKDSRAEFKEAVDRIRDWDHFARWKRSGDFKKLNEVRSSIELATNEPLIETLNRGLGNCSAFAVFPVDTNSAATAFLVRFGNDQTFQKAMTLWEKLDEREEQNIPYGGSVIRLRAPRKEKHKPEYVVTLGRTVIVCDQEWLARDMIDRDRNAEPSERTGSDALDSAGSFSGLESRLSERTRLLMFFNPEGWPQQKSDSEAADPVDQWIVGKYQACEGVMVGVHGDQGVHLEAHAKFSEPLFDRQPRESKSVPLPDAPNENSSFLTVKGQLPGESIARFLNSFIAELSAKQQHDLKMARFVLSGLMLQNDPIDGFVGRLGPAWAMSVCPTNAAVPVTMTLVLGIREKNGKATEDDNLRDALGNVLETSRDILEQQLKTQAGAISSNWEVAYKDGPYRHLVKLTGVMSGFEPAVSVTTRTITLTTNAGSLMTSPGEESGESAERGPDFEMVLYVDRIRNWLRDSESSIAPWIVSTRSVGLEEALNRVRQLERTLRVVDRIEVDMDVEDDEFSGRASFRIVNER